MANGGKVQMLGTTVQRIAAGTTTIDGNDSILALQYPVSMCSTDEQWLGAPVLMFSIYRQHGAGYNKLKSDQVEMAKAGHVDKTSAVIMLPMPSNGLKDSISNNIGTGDNSFLQEAFAAGMGAAMGASGFVDTIKKTSKALYTTVKTEAVVNINKAGGAYNTHRGASQTIAANRGNHGYTGTEPRSFTFNWRFVAKNLTELKAIGNIIQVLREASVGDPKGDPNGYLVSQAPPLVSVQEKILGEGELSKIRYTPRFGTGDCQISNFSVNTGSDGLYATIDGTAGDPVVFDIELSIKELLQPTAEMFRELARIGASSLTSVTPKRYAGDIENYSHVGDKIS